MDNDLFKQMYQGFVGSLQKSGHEIRTSVLKKSTWTVVVSPRPFLMVRTKYDGESATLVVSTRRPLVYKERLRRPVNRAAISDIAAAAVALHGPPRKAKSAANRA
jgi:hypothetical protein